MQNDGEEVMKLVYAAVSLGLYGGIHGKVGKRSIADTFVIIALLRASAIGWHECSLFIDAPAGVRLAIKQARKLDKRADYLCSKIPLPSPYSCGKEKTQARLLWYSFRNVWCDVASEKPRNVWCKVNHEKLVWMLITFGLVDIEPALTSPHETPAYWNAFQNRQGIFQKVQEYCKYTMSDALANQTLICNARNAARALNKLDRLYRDARQSFICDVLPIPFSEQLI